VEKITLVERRMLTSNHFIYVDNALMPKASYHA
jgi:hypothetical protein